MHKKTLIIGIILGAVLAGGGVFAWNFFSAKSNSNPQQASQQSDKLKNPVISQTFATGDVSSGDGLTPMQMYDELQKVTDPEEFNRKYITYTILLRNNESGMSRLAEEKSSRQELKAAAAQSMVTDRAFINNMLSWQRLWGYSHH